MIKRDIEKRLKNGAKEYPVVLLTGPRQSGKTTLTKMAFPKKAYVSFENLDYRHLAENDPRGFLAQYPQGAIFDEIQHCPNLLSYMQEIVDTKNKNGFYILTGSQNILLLKSIQQSLAGRVDVLKLLPFSMNEISGHIGNADLNKLLFTGFYPRIYDQNLDPSNTMRNYVETYVQRDVREIINVKSLRSFHNFLKLCAGRVGQILNMSNLANDLGLSHTTIREWLSILEASYVIFLLPAYYKNFNKRIIKSPKLYFTDVGLACYLLGIEKSSHVARDPLLGGIFENLIIMDVLKSFWNRGKTAPMYYFRDNVGNEIDLIIEKERKLIGVEIKAGQTVNLDWFKGLDYLKRIDSNVVANCNLFYGGSKPFIQKDVNIYPFNNVFRFLKDRNIF